MTRAIRLEEREPSALHRAAASISYAFVLKWAGDVDAARPMWARLRSFARETDAADLTAILYYSAFHELIAEDWNRAGQYAEESHSLAVQTERPVEIAFGLWARAVVSAYRGVVAEARVGTEHAARLVAEVGGIAAGAIAGWPAGVLELSVGNHGAAVAALRVSTNEQISRGVEEPGLIFGFPEHVEAAIAVGELDEASELLDWIDERAQRLDRAWALACSARGRALLAAARRDEAATDLAFARAYQQHARRPQQLRTYELARTLLAQGSILRRRQRKREAAEALEQARGIFEHLGAQVYAERARSELARIGGRALAAGDELTETERRIADLLAQGRSNKEVAAALSLSRKTVEWNLSKVYAKLGVRSRAELAATRR